MNCLANSFIGSAATKITVHGFGDLRVGWIRRLREQSGSGHNLSGLAIAALRNLFGDPGLLQDMETIGAETFDGYDIFPGDLRDGSRAGANGRTFHVHGACTAEARAATKLGSRKLKRVSQTPKAKGSQEPQFTFLSVPFTRSVMSAIKFGG